MSEEPKDLNFPTPSEVEEDPWRELRKYTPARIGLGHAGISQPTKHHLSFQLDHARARDAVHSELNLEELLHSLNQHGYEPIALHSQAIDRRTYLQRPDLGRRLDDTSRKRLTEDKHTDQPYDLAFIIADGLSAFAVQQHAVNLLNQIVPQLQKADWNIAPITVVEQGRVAISDDIGALLNAEQTVILIGERPGLSSPDSLGVYLTYDPKPGRTDADRNCISNIRSAGLSYEQAAHKLMYLLSEARRKKLSGIGLKDEAKELQPVEQGALQPAGNFLVEKNT